MNLPGSIDAWSLLDWSNVIFDRSNLFFDRSKNIENHSKSFFKNISFSRVVSLFKLFQKFFLSLSLRSVKIQTSLIFMQNVFEVWEFKEHWLKILFLGDLGSIQVFFFFWDQSNLFFNRSKLQLKIWFESAYFDRCWINRRYFWLIESIFRSIENCIHSFLKTICFSCVLSLSNFSKAFLSLFDRSKIQSKIFVISPQISSRVFDL